MAGTTALVAVLALSIGLGASYLVARRRAASDGLSPHDRRAIAVAVRNGQQVDDPRLRPAAAAMAGAMLARLDRVRPGSTWRRWMWRFLVIATVLSIVGVVVDSHPWRHVVSIAINVVFAGALWLSQRMSGNAADRVRAALVANGGGPAESTT